MGGVSAREEYLIQQPPTSTTARQGLAPFTLVHSQLAFCQILFVGMVKLHIKWCYEKGKLGWEANNIQKCLSPPPGHKFSPAQPGSVYTALYASAHPATIQPFFFIIFEKGK